MRNELRIERIEDLERRLRGISTAAMGSKSAALQRSTYPYHSGRMVCIGYRLCGSFSRSHSESRHRSGFRTRFHSQVGRVTLAARM